MELTPGVIALIGTIFGGVGLKVIEAWLGRAKDRNTDAAQIRDELRVRADNYKSQVDELEAELDALKEKYWALREAKAQVEIQLATALERIKQNAEEAQKSIEQNRDRP